MSGPADLLGLLGAAGVGWGIWRWYRRFPGRPNAVVVIGLWSVVGPALWMFFLALAGVGWPVWLLVLPVGVALLLGVNSRKPLAPLEHVNWAWLVPVATLAGGHAVLLALRPAAGWDFRYIWGLKAKVFALAATHDASWLAYPAHFTQHPAYPPLWPDLLAMGIRLGGTAEGVAAVWDAFLVIALAAACWDNLRDAKPQLRLIGAAVGACAPAVLSWPYSGYADLVVAFLAAVALGSVVRLYREKEPDPSLLLTLSAAVAGLCLAKNEAMVLGLGVALAAWWFGKRSTKIVVASAFLVPVASWQLFVAASGIPRDPLTMHIHAWLVTGVQILSWLPMQFLAPTSLLLLAWVAAGVALARHDTIPAAAALAVWWCGVVAAYLTSPDPTVWHLNTSFDRVIATPLPATISLALGATLPAVQARLPGLGRQSADS